MLKKLNTLLFIFLGGLSTSLSHGMDITKAPVNDQSLWKLRGFPIPFHHEHLYQPGLQWHDWPSFLFDIIFWALVWILIFKLIKLASQKLKK